MIVTTLREMGGAHTSAQIAIAIADRFPTEIKNRKNWKGAMVGILSSKRELFTKTPIGTASNPYLWSLVGSSAIQPSKNQKRNKKVITTSDSSDSSSNDGSEEEYTTKRTKRSKVIADQ